MSQTPIFVVYFDTLLGQTSPKFHPKITNPYFYSHFRNRVIAEAGRRKNIHSQFFCFMLCLQGFEGIFACVFLILPYKPPKGKILANGLPKHF